LLLISAFDYTGQSAALQQVFAGPHDSKARITPCRWHRPAYTTLPLFSVLEQRRLLIDERHKPHGAGSLSAGWTCAAANP
jgi:hypothetical protein